MLQRPDIVPRQACPNRVIWRCLSCGGRRCICPSGAGAGSHVWAHPWILCVSSSSPCSLGSGAKFAKLCAGGLAGDCNCIAGVAVGFRLSWAAPSMFFLWPIVCLREPPRHAAEVCLPTLLLGVCCLRRCGKVCEAAGLHLVCALIVWLFGKKA